MSTALQVISQNTTTSIWDDSKNIEEIRKIFAPKLTDIEFQIYVGMGKATGLNPFKKEIWAVKYGKDKDGNDLPAQIFIGRDGYRKSAQNHPDYDFHQPDAVYENDIFQVVDGAVRHSYTLKNRGKLIGAYCIAKRRKSSKPQYVFVELEEYSTGQSLWADPVWKDNKYGGKYKQGGKPATMIKKVAEAQCLRAAFQELFGGTYAEEEMYQDENQGNVIDGDTTSPKGVKKSELLINKLKLAKGHQIDEEQTDIVEAEFTEKKEFANPEQMKEIHALIAVKGFANGRMQKALEYYGVESLGHLTKEQADDFIVRLNKEEDK